MRGIDYTYSRNVKILCPTRKTRKICVFSYKLKKLKKTLIFCDYESGINFHVPGISANDSPHIITHNEHVFIEKTFENS
jgi:hypothetical protein